MRRRRISLSAWSVLILGGLLLALPQAATAQRHGSGSPGAGGGGISAITRPDGVDEKDSLKDFHQLLALQATSQQASQFQFLIKATEGARAQLQTFSRTFGTSKGTADLIHSESLSAAIEKARTSTSAFQETFSDVQKAGLKDQAKLLAKADVILQQEEKIFDQSANAKATGTDLKEQAGNLERALADFYQQQLALGRAMSIVIASGNDVAFTLPTVKKSIQLNGVAITLPVSTALEQTAASADHRIFKLEMAVDLSDLQQNITLFLRAQLETNENCRERIAVRQAWLTPATPASLVALRLHYERWLCSRDSGHVIANELAESDGTVEIHLTPAVEKSGTLKMSAAFGRIDATDMLADALRNQSFGDDLRDKVTQSVLSATLAASEFKTVLPPVLQNAVTLQQAKFQNKAAGVLSVIFEGQIELSNAQTDELANQLNQSLSAQGAAPQ